MAKNPLTDFFRRAGLKGWRSQSSALTPLSWVIAILLSGLIWLATHQGSPWIQGFLCFLLSVAIGCYVYEHHYLIRHNPDALRSDWLIASKFAIEKGFVGDNKTGLMEINPEEITSVIERRIGGKS